MTTLGTTRERPTHCKHGHEFTELNTRINRNADGSFRQYRCRACAAEAQRRAVERKRESMTPDEWATYIDARRATQREKDRAARRAQGIKSRAEIAAVRARERKAQTAESATARAAKRATREAAKIRPQQERERGELAEQNRQDEQEALMAQARDHAHVAAGPFPIVDPLVRVPAACRRGHELTARTVHVTTRVVDGDTVPGGVECIRCLREDCYRAHYRMSAADPVPPELLDEAEFIRQPCGTGHASRRAEPWPTSGWWARVDFASGWGFCDPDPTPELRAAREAARAEEALRVDEATRARIADELDEIELRDARLRREQRRHDAEAATAAIRAAMTAARGGVAV
ncbi:hypothetical protein AXK56_09255 [Tsukamurella pulmonis]|uniref:Uncharacterized protein n=1 Tax=Tsukamurella pulmonis TaxID=47312 RepID=A0A1H1BLV0_9ACTN|nr:hypothetical protein [Tsukamurella pulmonis]KXO90284.1 hypothetical protein AXK56_09255 [Tsukamurella pulmonis]SDQ52928.1 hypothetical protein SAMN04489765_0759 [Tsukamurella pulmonis]SUP24902.1 Uncharacterised protein [Tsukamurella pulmonis]